MQTDSHCKMTESQKRDLMQKVFDKLEKHTRLSKLQKALQLEENKTHDWLEAWEGPEPE